MKNYGNSHESSWKARSASAWGVISEEFFFSFACCPQFDFIHMPFQALKPFSLSAENFD